MAARHRPRASLAVLCLLLLVPVGGVLVATSGAVSGPASIPFKAGDDLGTQLVRVAVVFVVLAAVFVAGVIAWRRLGGKAPFAPRHRRLAVVETLRLSPRTTLFLVELDGEPLLLGQQGQTLTVLANRAAAGAQAKGGSP